jgi:hypothetical protein
MLGLGEEDLLKQLEALEDSKLCTEVLTNRWFVFIYLITQQ